MSRLVARPVSTVILGLAVAMVLCAFAGWGFSVAGYAPRPVDERSTLAMMVAAGFTAAVGVAGRVWSRKAPDVPFGRREATFTVVGIWLASGVLGGMPYMIGVGLPPVDAFFEAISGFTTTGATVVEDIEASYSRPVLLWRSLTQWLGGMGIVVLFVAIFPSLGVGGKHMFRSEVPGVTSEGLVPRITETSLALWKLYVGFTALLTGLLLFLGMDLFDSVNHALTTLATGGFSPRNASMAHYDSTPIELTITVFMLLGGVNFALYYGIVRTRRPSILLRSIEFRAYVGIAVVCTALLTMTLVGQYGSWVEAFRRASFAVASFLTSTGFVTSDVMTWPAPGLMLVLALMFVGGSAGSTSGGMKVSRVVILFEAAWVQIRRSIRPSLVQVVRLDRKVLDDTVQLEVSTFFFLYLVTIGVFTLLVSAIDGTTLPTAFGVALSCVSNMGPMPWYVGADHFAGYSDAVKVLAALAMVLGRLELFTLLALLVPDLWRR